ncbi:MAG: PTPA-CTERM sorting domain-containing protein [Nodosilinea sp.]
MEKQMNKRCVGIGLGVGATLTFNVLWPNSAQAFSLKKVSVENLLRDPEILPLKEIGFQGPVDVTVIQGQEPELIRFGGIWDVDLGESSIYFDLNSVFGNVESGDDVYKFKVLNSSGFGRRVITGALLTTGGSFTFQKTPVFNLLSGNKFEIVFPLEFAFPVPAPNAPRDPRASNLTNVDLTLRVDLITEPVPVPTPALLPGLVGMGLSVLYKRREDKG